MKNFIKLNFISLIYALCILLPFELTINVLRISRLTNLSINTINILSFSTAAFGIFIGSISIISIVRKWTEKPKWYHVSVVLWFPYFVLLLFIGASLFPATNPQDIPSAGTGFIALGMVAIFPAFIIFINHLAIFTA